MKITTVETCVLTVPTPHPLSLEFPHHKLVVADIMTDAGLRGLGYSLVFGGGGAEAERYAAKGCRYYKMKIHDPDPRANRKRVETVRNALGGGVRMIVDVNQKLDVLGNIRQAALLEDLDLVWYEEPVVADDLAACEEVSKKIGIPVATGENNYTRYEFRDLVERKAARYLMPDVCRANGYSEVLKIGHLAAAHQVAVSPHVVYELSIQICGALSNGFLVELMDWMPPDLFEELPQCKDGEIRIPERPGHGMTLARGAIEKYRTAGGG